MTRGFATASLAIALALGSSAAVAETPIQLVSGAARPAAQPLTHCTVRQDAVARLGPSEVECLISGTGRAARGEPVAVRVLIQAQAPITACAHAAAAQEVALPGAAAPVGPRPVVIHDWTRAPCAP